MRKITQVEEYLHNLIKKGPYDSIFENNGISPELYDNLNYLFSLNYSCIKNQAQINAINNNGKIKNSLNSIKYLGGKSLLERRLSDISKRRNNFIENNDEFSKAEEIYKNLLIRKAKEISKQFHRNSSEFENQLPSVLNDFYTINEIIDSYNISSFDKKHELGNYISLLLYKRVFEAYLQANSLNEIFTQLKSSINDDGSKKSIETNKNLSTIYDNEILELHNNIQNMIHNISKTIKEKEKRLDIVLKELPSAPEEDNFSSSQMSNYVYRNTMKYYSKNFYPYYMDIDMSNFAGFKTKQELESEKEEIYNTLISLRETQNHLNKAEQYSSMLLKRLIFSGLNDKTTQRSIKDKIDDLIYRIPNNKQKIGLVLTGTYIHINEFEILRMAAEHLDNENIKLIINNLSARFNVLKMDINPEIETNLNNESKLEN